MTHLVATLIYFSQIYSYYVRGDRSPSNHWLYHAQGTWCSGCASCQYYANIGSMSREFWDSGGSFFPGRPILITEMGGVTCRFLTRHIYQIQISLTPSFTSHRITKGASRGVGVGWIFYRWQFVFSTRLGCMLKIKNCITCLYRTVLERNDLFRLKLFVSKYFTPLVIEWCPPNPANMSQQ